MSDSPEFDELDDLDEFLDEFEEGLDGSPSEAAKTEVAVTSAIKTKTDNDSSAEPESKDEGSSKASGEPKPSSAKGNEDGEGVEGELPEEFKKGLEELLKDMNGSPEALSQFETLIEKFSGQLSGEDFDDLADATRDLNINPQNANTKASAQPGEKKSFQDTINQTMNRLNESKQEIDESVQNGIDEDFLEKMLKDMSGLSGDGGDVDMAKLIYDLLSQVSSKDVLYEPMKEMDSNFDDWLKENKPKLSAEDYENYVNQRKVAREIVEIFENPKYNDEDTETRKTITSKMELLQSYGSPPMDLMKNAGENPLKDLEDMGLPDLSNLDPSQMPDMDNCAQQ